ncbi:MAG: ribonuclease P protein component [Elusimicrobia bacterium]|nr:ribonuclease P protein component [Candidatus Liberimonas magnetica]
MSFNDNINKDLTGFTFRYKERLHSQKDFKQAISLGRKLVHPAIFIYIYKRKDSEGLTRLGLVTSGKLGIAAHRNRLKRRLREIFRLNKYSMARGLDIVFIPKKDAIDLNFEKLRDLVLGLLEKAQAFEKRI